MLRMRLGAGYVMCAPSLSERGETRFSVARAFLARPCVVITLAPDNTGSAGCVSRDTAEADHGWTPTPMLRTPGVRRFTRLTNAFSRKVENPDTGRRRPTRLRVLPPPIGVFLVVFGLVTSVLHFQRRDPVRGSYLLFTAIVSAAALGRMFWLWLARRW